MLFNPGPTNVHQSVRVALNGPDICHREPEFSSAMREVKSILVRMINGEETHEAIGFVSSGTGANEAVISSIHGKVLLIDNGKYEVVLV